MEYFFYKMNAEPYFMKKLLKNLFLPIILSFVNHPAHAQLFKFLSAQIDTSYIKDQTRLLTVRLLGSSKLNTYSLVNGSNSLSYRANNSYNIGVGAVYSFLGANVTVKIPGINNDTAQYGVTKKFDFQAYAFPRKIALDLYLQYYKGFYITEKGITQNYLPANRNALRPDIRTQHVGVNGSYVFNAKQFSFRAAFIQNEYQKKSAGTALLGGGIHYYRISGDSAIIPSDIAYSNFFDNSDFNKMGAFSVGVHGGYAYTLVVAKHFFFTSEALLGAGINYSYLRDDAHDVFERKTGFQSNVSYKAAIGYNSDRFYAGLLYIGYWQQNSTPVSNAWQQNEPAVVRLVLAKRFPVNPFWEKKKKTKTVIDIQ